MSAARFEFDDGSVIEEVETLYRLAASHFGGQVRGSMRNRDLTTRFPPTNLELDLATGRVTQVGDDARLGFERYLMTQFVNRFIAGKTEPELEITCDERGDVAFKFLRPPVKTPSQQ